ncbi:diguanylate cyclase/phosphodiesterase (GGDEF & EAL domains) with PAS/PAC sensor(s) [hydrothermal vent metagenome]|uniref:Diguanylate cyclase/phosphodiesterase (GGDEF & EAL domains) with PAS/PAC sensor(S) n=1 Tax=hydrothermal vent metagenome TaxID=652676 RepID=A0A3B0WXS6_9ZZZZ
MAYLFSIFSMRIAGYNQWGIIAISLIFILFLFQKTFNPIIDQRSDILAKNFLITELQYATLKSLSKSQLKDNYSFDRLNAQISHLNTTLVVLKNNSAVQAIPKLKGKLTHLINSVEKQNTLIEEFKTHYSVLQNSLQFFPYAFDECRQSFLMTPYGYKANNHNKRLLQLKNTLVSGLMTMQDATPKHLTQLTEQLDNLKKQDNLSSNCLNFIDHGHLIAKYTFAKHQILNQLYALKVNEKIHDFYSQLEQTTSVIITKNQTYYFIILIFAIFLLIYIGLTLTNLFRSNQQLKQTLKELSEQQTLFEALIKASSAITQSKDKNSLYQKICNIATQEALFESCWIGKVMPNKTLIPVAYAGEGKQIFKNLIVPLNNTKQKNNGTILECYLQKKPIITNHYQERMINTQWANAIQKFNIQGNAALPILVEENVVSILVVYTRKPYFFTKENNEFLHQLVHDISITLERFKAVEEQNIHQQNLAISSMAFESHEAIMITDENTKIIRSNQAFTKLTGYSQQEILGKSPSILKSGLHADAFYSTLWTTIFKTGEWQGEIWNRKKDGTLYPCWQSISAVLNADGNVSHYISHALDLTKDKESQRQINHLNYHDKLTNLPNRSLLIDRLKHALSQVNQRNYNVLFLININRFKLFNDSLGHSAGDELLIKIAQRLQTIIFHNTTNLTVARIGNDEFTLSCLTQTDNANKALQKAENIAQTIQKKLNENFTIQGQMAIVDTSIGATLFTPCNQTAEVLLQEANTALYQAKNIAKQTAQSTIKFYEETMKQQDQHRLKLENQLRTALTNQEFKLQYQPQIDIKSNQIIGVETLVRWQKQDGTLIAPFQFIPALEESGLIIPVGMWIIKEAIFQAQFLHKMLPNLTMSINLSAIQFNDKNLITNVQQLLKKSQYPAQLLEFEVTESLLMSDIEETIKKLNAFADLGIKIAIDDFGTGYSSLAYLKRFPVSKLKIDKAFIDEITHHDSSDPAIVQATIQMAHALNITTIAEGVEEQSQLDLLNTMGCNEIQGYFFSKPLPPKELQQFIQDRNTNFTVSTP